MLSHNVACLILGSFLLLLAGCDDELDVETGISAFSNLNSDGDILAVLVGSKVKGRDRPAVSETKPVLLTLNDKSLLRSHQQIEDWVIRDMAWRPAHDNHLYYVTFGKVFGGGGGFYEYSSGRWFTRGPGKLVMFEARSNDNATTAISQDGYPNILSCFRWSPDGAILAGLAVRPTSQMLNSGELAVSFDGGKTCEATGIEMSGYPAWLNNDELYLTTNRDTIARVSRDSQSFRIVEELTKDFGVRLKGR